MLTARAQSRIPSLSHLSELGLVQVTSYLNAGEDDGTSTLSWQGRLGNLSDRLRNGFQQLADPPLDLPGSQVSCADLRCK